MEIFGIAKWKGRILGRFENSEKYKDLYERSQERDWMAKKSPRNVGDLVVLESRLGLAIIIQNNCIKFVAHRE